MSGRPKVRAERVFEELQVIADDAGLTVDERFDALYAIGERAEQLAGDLNASDATTVPDEPLEPVREAEPVVELEPEPTDPHADLPAGADGDGDEPDEQQ